MSDMRSVTTLCSPLSFSWKSPTENAPLLTPTQKLLLLSQRLRKAQQNFTLSEPLTQIKHANKKSDSLHLLGYFHTLSPSQTVLEDTSGSIQAHMPLITLSPHWLTDLPLLCKGVVRNNIFYGDTIAPSISAPPSLAPSVDGYLLCITHPQLQSAKDIEKLSAHLEKIHTTGILEKIHAIVLHGNILSQYPALEHTQLYHMLFELLDKFPHPLPFLIIPSEYDLTSPLYPQSFIGPLPRSKRIHILPNPAHISYSTHDNQEHFCTFFNPPSTFLHYYSEQLLPQVLYHYSQQNSLCPHLSALPYNSHYTEFFTYTTFPDFVCFPHTHTSTYASSMIGLAPWSCGQSTQYRATLIHLSTKKARTLQLC